MGAGAARRHLAMGEAFVSTLAPARREALRALGEAERSGRYVRDVLARSEQAALSSRDRALCLRLALATTQAQGCLDEVLDRFLAKPHRVAPTVRWALRIAACELLYLNTPVEVAVSQGVELVRSCARSAAGLANAVLRRVSACTDDYLAANDIEDSERAVASLARRGGVPLWFMKEFVDAYGCAAARRFVEQAFCAAQAFIHVHPRFQHEWQSYGNPTSLPGCLGAADIGGLVRQRAFKRGAVAASDFHAQLIATSATRGGSCLEIGAGRGTKTYVMCSQTARAGFVRTHVAVDLYEGKCRANLERLAHAGIKDVEAFAGDACDLDAVLAPLDAKRENRCLFDTVFVDAPCSGTGTMRRHPEIPWRLASQEALRALPALQQRMLCAAAERLKPGGELFYATCSVLPCENNRVVEAFLDSQMGAGFCVVPLSGADIYSVPPFDGLSHVVARHEDACGRFQSLPLEDGLDGHFCVRLMRDPST